MIMTQLKRLMMAGFGFAALATAVLLPGHAPVVRAAMLDGEATFRAKCAICHGADGSGNTPTGKKMGIRALGSAAVQKQSDAQLSGIIQKGKDKMPAFGSSLSADQVREIVAFIRTLRK
jgi:mono/diheme cytochrome c family protein